MVEGTYVKAQRPTHGMMTCGAKRMAFGVGGESESGLNGSVRGEGGGRIGGQSDGDG